MARCSASAADGGLCARAPRSRPRGTAAALLLLSPLALGWLQPPALPATRAASSAFVLSGSLALVLGVVMAAAFLAVGYMMAIKISLMPLDVKPRLLRDVVRKFEATPEKATNLFKLVVAFGKQATSPWGVHFTLVDPLSGEEDTAKYVMDNSLKTVRICYPPADAEQYAKTFDVADIKVVDSFAGSGTQKSRSECMVKMDFSTRSIVLRLASKADAENFIKCVKVLQKYNIEAE